MVDLWGMSAQMCMQFCCDLLCTKKALRIFTELMTTTRTTSGFLGPTFWVQK